VIPSYRVDGPDGAPLVVLANSLGTTSAMWEPQLQFLTGRFRVVRYEHRGHGGTPAPPGPYSIEQLGGDVLDLLDAVGEERASLCGISLGGMVAMWLGAHAAERVDRLVLCSTATQLPPAGQWAERAAMVRASGPMGLLDTLLGRWFTPGFPDRRPDVARLVAGMLGAADAEGYAGCCEAIGAMDQRDDLAGIGAPTLVIAGAADPVTPPAAALALQQGIAGSSLVVLPGAAHLANIEQPERFTAAIVDHLAGPPVERGRRIRRRVLGDAHVDRSEAAATSFTAPFHDLLTRYAWGEIWTRPGLDQATRSCITLAMLVALGRFDELALHVRGARRNGLSPDQIGEVLLQSAVYCGVPAANSAFAVAQRVLSEDTND
jgi:3-oxoadipate enol-lactonase / 4-carboxymuconolactone decarboxylase